MTALLVALAGGLGAMTRFLVDTEIGRRTPRLGVPLGTLVVNVTGSLLLGWITGWWAFHTGDPGLRLILGTGFMGGYTTFSTASVEAARMARGDQNLRASIHAGVVLLLSVTAAALGTWLGSL
ncbi:MAG: CrcB family protein [Propionicimonas sp.]